MSTQNRFVDHSKSSLELIQESDVVLVKKLTKEKAKEFCDCFFPKNFVEFLAQDTKTLDILEKSKEEDSADFFVVSWSLFCNISMKNVCEIIAGGKTFVLLLNDDNEYQSAECILKTENSIKVITINQFE